MLDLTAQIGMKKTLSKRHVPNYISPAVLYVGLAEGPHRWLGKVLL